MQTLLQFLEIFKDNNSLTLIIGVASLIFGFVSVFLGIIAIFIAFRFYYLAKETESNTISLLSKISTKSDDLGIITTDLIKKLTDFSTIGVKEYIENVLKITHHPTLPYSPIKDIKQTDDKTEILIDTYIRYYYFLYLTNFYATIEYAHESSRKIDIHENLKNALTISYNEFIRIEKIIETDYKKKLSDQKNCDLYFSTKNLKNNVRSYEQLAEFLKFK